MLPDVCCAGKLGDTGRLTLRAHARFHQKVQYPLQPYSLVDLGSARIEVTFQSNSAVELRREIEVQSIGIGPSLKRDERPTHEFEISRISDLLQVEEDSIEIDLVHTES